MEDPVATILQADMKLLSEYGIFVVPNGAVESWLPSLEIDAEKKGWLERMFAAMGDDPNNGDYVRPDSTDVWEFISEVNSWLFDPDRKGLRTD